MPQDGRQKFAIAGVAALAVASMSASPALAAGPVTASVLLFGSAQQTTVIPDEYSDPAAGSLAPEPDSVRSFESLRTKSLASNNDEDTEKHYSVFGFRGARNSFFLPLYKEHAATRKDNYRLLDGWGLKWQHQLESGSSFAVAAHRSENLYQQDDSITGETTSTMASFSWTSRWKGSYKPSFTGSVFLGDEINDADTEQDFGRRYYGFSVGGEMTLFRTHTPYLSLKLQRNEYVDAGNGADSLFSDSLLSADQASNPLYGPEMYSRLSAGWNWRVRANWSVTAEANYLLEDNDLNRNFDQSRFYFGTRYDFR